MKMNELTRPHIDSFNWFLWKGLKLSILDILPYEMKLGETIIKVEFRDAFVKSLRGKGVGDRSGVGVDSAMDVKSKPNQLPCEARMSCSSYTGTLCAMITVTVGDKRTTCERKMCDLPIMVKSDACVLSKVDRKQLIANKEDGEEIGGYFIVNGHEKVIRMLIQTRRNFPVAIERETWTKHSDFTKYGVIARCVASDGSIVGMTLHYTRVLRIVCSFIFQKKQWFIPLGYILRALLDCTDYELYSRFLINNSYCLRNKKLTQILCAMMAENHRNSIYSQKEALAKLGYTFRDTLRIPEWHSDDYVGTIVLRKCIAVHVVSSLDKFNFLSLCCRKLMALVENKCAAESVDSPSNMEVLTSGHLYALVVKDRLDNWLQNVGIVAKKMYESSKSRSMSLDKLMNDALIRTQEITSAINNFVSTGNITSKNGALGLMQASGLCVGAEKINHMRFLSHFRAVHRGSFYLTSRVSAVRKLKAESWGFICPVHTPDGAPCGLLNHLAVEAKISDDEILGFKWNEIFSWNKFRKTVVSSENGLAPLWEHFLDIVFNGKVIGFCDRKDGDKVANDLRLLKFQENQLPKTTEIAYLPFTMDGCQFPGLYIATHQCRMVRPVSNLFLNEVEYIGSLEQVYLNIALEKQLDLDGYSHQEIKNTNILSFLANLTPFSESNPSPRNVYQCQMAKQTMGFPSYTLNSRSDHKMYVLQTPQSPLSRSLTYKNYNCDEYPMGTNAIVAIISYTGYDMEDSMIFNKHSVERGFMNAKIQKTLVIDLIDDYRSTDFIFACANDDIISAGYVDCDGLPPVGRVLRSDEPLYSCHNTRTMEFKVKKVDSSMNQTRVMSVRAIPHPTGARERFSKVCIQLNITRNPIIGDKSASRAGQKGICSFLYPPENLPFTEGGLVPDIIFNPHGFASRMTVGMMIELLANKEAALSGSFHDSSTFNYSEEKAGIEHFGHMLVEKGFNYYGLETMFSGVSGEQLEAAIFFGPIYYQRLRHMVSDKVQVRSTGPIDSVTQQPIKGRMRGGGIRVGEMERDGILSHGAVHVCLDRLLESSDQVYIPLCTKCGKSVGTEYMRTYPGEQSGDDWYMQRWKCRLCICGRLKENSFEKTVAQVSLPGAFNLLINQLAACNISLTFDTSMVKK